MSAVDSSPPADTYLQVDISPQRIFIHWQTFADIHGQASTTDTNIKHNANTRVKLRVGRIHSDLLESASVRGRQVSARADTCSPRK